MVDLYIFHYALNCLYLKGEKAIFLEDAVRTFDDTQRILFNDFFENFWRHKMRITSPSFITPANQDEMARQLRAKGDNILKPFSLPGNYESIESLLNMFSAKLYGSNDDSRQVFETIKSFKSKVKAYELWRDVNPAFLFEDTKVVELKGLETAIRKLLRNGRVVVKGEYGQMGMHSQIITNSRDVEGFLDRCSSKSFVATQEVNKQGLFIVEPFFDHTLAPSVCFYLTDDNIFLKYRHDRNVDNLEYVESSSPSESPNIEKISKFSFRYAKILQNMGYRGPVDFEFMENSEGQIKFCEINARYPISYYQSEFPIEGKPYRLKKFRLRKPNISFKLLDNLIGDYWFDPDKKIGVIPLNIPYFVEPQQRFALLFVGGNKTQIDEMYKAASVLKSSKQED